jgi:chromosome segregation ATPase
VEGARRAADVAANALAAAESRLNLASERHKKAEAALTEAQRELEAARRESASASAEVTKALKVDAEARAALNLGEPYRGGGVLKLAELMRRLSQLESRRYLAKLQSGALV